MASNGPNIKSIASPKTNMENPTSPGSTTATSESTPKPTPARSPKPKFHEIHSRPMPLNIYPIPFYAPLNPLSLLQVAYVILKDYFSPRHSHQSEPYRGYFSEATRSVHVTDPKTVRALWEMGFFGKGSLSRSEPTWLDHEKRRLGLIATDTSHEVTERRRQERLQFKQERARLEREALEEQLRRESKNPLTLNGSSTSPHAGGSASATVRHDSPLHVDDVPGQVKREAQIDRQPSKQTPNLDSRSSSTEPKSTEVQNRVYPSSKDKTSSMDGDTNKNVQMEEPVNQEHLDLSLEEAFFLSYSLGVLEIVDPSSNRLIKDQTSLLQLYRCNSYFPPRKPRGLQPDDQFMLNYVVYHHFRSLGWVVRGGIKFAVDFLLYQRGPVFTHATFAIMIVPSYTHPYWFETPERSRTVEKKQAKYKWHWLHCASRVQGQVVKTLVLAYVDVPPPMQDGDRPEDIGSLLRSYKIREFCVQRWSPNRNRE